MKKILLFTTVALLMTAFVLSPVAYAQVKNLTFIVNTATVPDTLWPTDQIVLVGTGTGSADSVLTNWGAGRALTNIGGDYWKTTLGFKVGDTLKYKIRVRSGGWEKDLSDGFLSQGHRNYAVVNKDTTFPLQFWNNATSAQPQFFRPWTAAPDSFINVYFRVNMQAVMDNGTFSWKATDIDSVGVRGYDTSRVKEELSWNRTVFLKREVAPGDGGGEFKIGPGSFFSGRVRLRKSQFTEGQKVPYKFLLGSAWGRDELSGGKPDRTFTIPVGKADTTLHWVFYNNERPVVRANSDTCTVTFEANMTTASQKGSFSVGSDTLQVQVGWFNTADSTRTLNMSRQGLTNIYKGTMTFKSSLTKFLDYQYFLVRDPGSAIREYYYNFQFTGSVASEQERRQVTVSSKTFTVKDTVVGVSAGRRQPYFENQRKLNKNVTVTWTVDLRPAYYQIILGGDSLIGGQGTFTVSKADSIKPWGVGINGPATNLPTVYPVGDWADWNKSMVADTSKRKMWDDGTHGDAVANDTIYTVQFAYTTANTLGKVSKFGIGGSDNETGFGLNHLDNIDDTNPTYTLNVQWGSINPVFYNRWDYDLKKPRYTGVVDLAGVPHVFTLAQNYPNPFNPSTKIEFSIPAQSKVELVVYNILGQEVATLVNETLNAGGHQATFDASRLASGMYLYRLTAGQFTSVKKMMLLK